MSVEDARVSRVKLRERQVTASRIPRPRMGFRISSFGFQILIWDCSPLGQCPVVRFLLLGEELFQDGTNFRHVHGGDLSVRSQSGGCRDLEICRRERFTI